MMKETTRRNIRKRIARPAAAVWISFAAMAAAQAPLPASVGEPILFVTRPQYREDHHNTETMFQKGEINEGSFRGGSALKILDAPPGETRTLLECPNGIVRDPDVSFDGRTIVFSMRRDANDDFHIYEIGSDGAGLRQLTFARGVTDIDPLYLPDGGIAFSSTRDPKYCMCNRHIMANLFRMDPDGANIHQIGKSTLFEGHGALLPDGRILYYRWEYIDRNFGDAQGLWTVRPDGTDHALYWGNNTASPGAVFDARPIPGRQQFICVFGSCHDRPWGALAIVDRRLGMDLRAPVVRTWPPDAIRLVGDGDWNRFNFDTFKQVTPKYEDPYPIDDRRFLCSRTIGNGEVMGIYLVDLDGSETRLHAEDPGCYDPMPLAPRERPPVIASHRDYENTHGTFYVADVYQGTHMKGVERGRVKFLRVVESPEKRHWTHPAWGGQGQEAPAMNWHDFNNKRILGTAPVEEDGSAYFAVPAETWVYFQLLDADGMMVQSMRSGTIVQPGERQACAGCHENRLGAPSLSPGYRPLALKRPPSPLAGWHGPPRTFSYMRDVQPVFDRHCVRCHDFGKEAGKKLILAGDRDLVFNASYNELWRKKYIAAIGAGPAQTQQALTWGSHASRLVAIIRAGHHGVSLDAESFERIVTWIDLNAPYYPEYASAYPGHWAGRCPLDDTQLKRLAVLTGMPYAPIMQFDQSPGPQVCFERPELSPCLEKAGPKKRGPYKEALAIIQAGGKMLSERPRADMEGFQACAIDQKREERYAARKDAEARNREAIRNGQRAYDAP